MAMHQHSEDINDPSHLSAVLERYEMLRLQEWEKVRCSMPHRWTYEEGSNAIRVCSSPFSPSDPYHINYGVAIQ